MVRKVTVALNGVTGRMGYRQHLVRSLLAIREQGGLERCRPASHLVKVFELAAVAGVLADPDLAVARMTAFLKERA